ncbi:MAG: 3,4-dihydroxy-2-butanone-4-phosphate synthase [Flavobacteriaceae bacterium TMED238]|jgi:3,4-dihydroxy 2-butanone 4-phosphate synthase / GTP cyclohydrolase II|nr:MAG: 3,4-dihydroxy-2-butanone-4-phosphate synthase [Flavobacteriaceae bacterium TMED238]
MPNNKFSKIPSIINDAKKGKMFILVDDKDRENEGDLVIPGSKCTPKIINFMAKHGRGLICLALSKKQIDKLKLPLMSPINKSRMQTAFTISIEAKKGITTGISAHDRAKTIQTAINLRVKKNDIVSPGHVFPLVARPGGVLERAGHTEASVDISKLSKLNNSSVICEVMNEDGRMARLNDLFKFSKKHKIKLASIEDIISYRLKNEKLISKVNTKVGISNKIGKIFIHNYKNNLENNINFAITKGTLSYNKSTPVRVLSTRVNNKNIFSNFEIKKALKFLSKYKTFLLLIINNDNRKKMSDSNINTLRYYGIGAQIIKDLKVKKMILVSRRKKKIIGLEGFGLKIMKQIIIK